MIDTPLFEGLLIRLGPIDPERDAEVFARWTHDVEYLHLSGDAPVRPLSVAQAHKKLDQMTKDAEKSHRELHFAIRKNEDDRLVGLTQLQRIQWSGGAAQISLGIGAPEDRGQGFGSEALRLMLRYAFSELNLHRLEAIACEYNTRAIRFLERAGFSVEVRRRQALHRGSKRWDLLHMGLLREEWVSAVRNPNARGFQLL
ncbi:MAG: GNAT family N-acetyltransferase [Chloroflexi bacterium]|nr:GNAT family N-acetyltransferase [Chloroflexota bacterium]